MALGATTFSLLRQTNKITLMIKRILFFLLYCLPFVAFSQPILGNNKAIWIWEKDSYAMLENEESKIDALHFFKSKGINRIYLYADKFGSRNLIIDKPYLFHDLIGDFHKNGISVYALLGSGYLNSEKLILPEYREDALDMVKRILAYNSAAESQARFDGINLDIEPHILDAWPEHKYQLLEYFLDMSKAIMDLKNRSEAILAIGSAIPFWLDGVSLTWQGHTKKVSDHVIDLYDYVALMDYRDHAEGRDGIISHALDELEYAAMTKKKVAIGVEVTPNEITKVSFNHLTENEMNIELNIAAKVFSTKPAFDGFVIHHYRGYLTWLDNQKQTDQ